MIGEPPKTQLKIGFIAKQEIHVGEELFFDYGIKDPDIPLLKTDAKKLQQRCLKYHRKCRPWQQKNHGPLPKEENWTAQYRVVQLLTYQSWLIT